MADVAPSENEFDTPDLESVILCSLASKGFSQDLWGICWARRGALGFRERSSCIQTPIKISLTLQIMRDWQMTQTHKNISEAARYSI